MDKPFSQHRSMLVSIRGAVLGGTRLDWAWIPVTEPTSARRIMFPFERVRNVKYAGTGQKMGLGKAVEMWYTGGELLGKSVFAGTDYGGHGQCVIFRSFFSFN